MVGPVLLTAQNLRLLLGHQRNPIFKVTLSLLLRVLQDVLSLLELVLFAQLLLVLHPLGVHRIQLVPRAALTAGVVGQR